jgi:ketosteroid isomerase-like protein
VSDNVKVLERHYEAFNRGDLEGLLEPFDPGVVFVEDPSVRPDAGSHMGIEGMRTFFQAMFDGSQEVAVDAVGWIDQGDLVIVEIRLHGRFRHTGIAGEARFFHVWTFRDGCITRLQMYTDKEQALRELGRPAAKR